jgi:hypothetical protein
MMRSIGKRIEAMKRVVSVSVGSSTRDHKAVVQLLGQEISLERIGTDGDVRKAQALYRELDGKVDAFGVGGYDLTLRVDDRQYTLLWAQRMVQVIQETPVVDGTRLRQIHERRMVHAMHEAIGGEIPVKRAMQVEFVSRAGIGLGLVDCGYEVLFGDFMFGLGLPIPLHTVRAAKRVARLLLPLITLLPMEWLTPTGSKQEENRPRWHRHWAWASVIAGDFLHIRTAMPHDVSSKVILTNTTTPADVEFCHQRGLKYLVTTTPRFQGRSFGTNVLEAAIVALAGKGRALNDAELTEMLDRLALEPTIERLN